MLKKQLRTLVNWKLAEKLCYGASYSFRGDS